MLEDLSTIWATSPMLVLFGLIGAFGLGMLVATVIDGIRDRKTQATIKHLRRKVYGLDDRA